MLSIHAIAIPVNSEVDCIILDEMHFVYHFIYIAVHLVNLMFHHCLWLKKFKLHNLPQLNILTSGRGEACQSILYDWFLSPYILWCIVCDCHKFMHLFFIIVCCHPYLIMIYVYFGCNELIKDDDHFGWWWISFLIYHNLIGFLFAPFYYSWRRCQLYLRCCNKSLPKKLF